MAVNVAFVIKPLVCREIPVGWIEWVVDLVDCNVVKLIFDRSDFDSISLLIV